MGGLFSAFAIGFWLSRSYSSSCSGFSVALSCDLCLCSDVLCSCFANKMVMLLQGFRVDSVVINMFLFCVALWFACIAFISVAFLHK